MKTNNDSPVTETDSLSSSSAGSVVIESGVVSGSEENGRKVTSYYDVVRWSLGFVLFHLCFII